MLCLLTGAAAIAQTGPGEYRVIKTIRVGGDGGFDWPFADPDSGKLYIPRSGPSARVSILDLNTFQSITEISGVTARNVAVDSALHTAFSSSSPVAMWNTQTNALIKSIPVEGRPAGILADEFNHDCSQVTAALRFDITTIFFVARYCANTEYNVYCQ